MVARSSPSASLPSRSSSRSASVSLSWHGASQPPTSWPFESATAASFACCTACSKRMLLGLAGGRDDSEPPGSCAEARTCCAAPSAASNILLKAFLKPSLVSSSTREMLRAFSSSPRARQRRANASWGESCSHFLASCSRVPAILARFAQKPLAAARGVGPRRAQAEIGCCAVTTTNSSSSAPGGLAGGLGGVAEPALAVVDGALAALPLSLAERAAPPGSSSAAALPAEGRGAGGRGEGEEALDEASNVGATSSGRMQALASEAEGPGPGSGASGRPAGGWASEAWGGG
mmetsp:Transcript_115798/g.338660  ORF Transcript_115798/g.338660 Transcript_115798/m.338660 type:complete len:290 (+) Transcript_115798:224-1093(+)